MFNDNLKTSKGKFATVLTGAALIAMALTLGYATVADAQMQATVSKPVLRTEYKGTDMIDLSGVVNLRNGNQKISISLRDSDLKPALRMIADKAGLNVIFHSSVEGQVTLDLVNVTLNDAFKMIMQACDLSYVIDNGTLIVMSKAASLESDISKQNMMTIPVKYADATKVADFLNSNVFSTNRPGLSNNKIVVTNPVTNELVIFGTMNDYKMAQKVVSRIDVAPKTVSFRVNHTTPKEMATLICQSLFPNASTGKDSDSKTGTSDSGDNSSSTPMSGGTLTGGATSSSNSGSSSGSSTGSSSLSGSDNSSSSTTEEDIALGKGVVACTMKGNVENNKLKSLTGTALTVTYFPQKGTINVTGGSDYQAEMVKNFIQANDKKQPQAYMEVQIVELSEDGSRTFNNTWNLMTPFFAGSFGQDGLKTSNPMFFTGGPYVSGVDDDGNPVKTFDRYHGKNTLGWSITYLIESGKGRILANPKVIVTNGKKSVIDLTSDYVKSIDEEIMSNTIGGIAGVTRTYEIGDDMGISIELTPFISPDGYVTLNLKPNYATMKEEVTSVSISNPDLPITAAVLLQRRNLELSNVRIKDGETLVLGGMIQEEEKKEVSKFPLLGDLPVIGGVFRNTHTTNSKSELVIMVTPHIIKDTEDVASDTENL